MAYNMERAKKTEFIKHALKCPPLSQNVHSAQSTNTHLSDMVISVNIQLRKMKQKVKNVHKGDRMPLSIPWTNKK